RQHRQYLFRKGIGQGRLRPSELRIRLGDAGLDRMGYRTGGPGLWRNRPDRPFPADQGPGSSPRAADVRRDSWARTRDATLQRRDPIRPDPGDAAPDPALAGRVRDPLLTRRASVAATDLACRAAEGPNCRP